MLHDSWCAAGEDKEVDSLTAGSPCQPYTRNRNSRQRDGTMKHKDAKSLSDMVLMIKERRPRAALLENDTGMMDTESVDDPVTPLQRLQDMLTTNFPGWAFRKIQLGTEGFLLERRRRFVLKSTYLGPTLYLYPYPPIAKEFG